MEQAHAEQPPPAAGPPPVANVAEPGLLENASALWHDVRALAYDHLQLAALETQRAWQGLVAILAYGIIIGVLAVSAWLSLAGLIVRGLVNHGIGAGTAVLGVVVLNVLGAGGFAVAVRRESRALCYPATVRNLKPTRATAAVMERA